MFLNKQEVLQLQNGVKMVSLSSKIARYKIFVNVGGADMPLNEGDERIAFGPMAQGHKKYGATSSARKRNEQAVVYNVQRGDTLQGIAIKFGVHTEQIRRVNQLWTNDSLFLRDKLLIPSTQDGHPSPTTPGSPSSPTSFTPSSKRSIDHSEKSAEEFLSRIDSTIASSKKLAMTKAEEKATASWVTFDSNGESSDHPNSSRTSITREGRHLRYSLRKLEKAQEELFQL